MIHPLHRPVRLAHFSDIHLTSPRLGWRKRDLLTKKVTGWVNLRLMGRGATFREAPSVTDTLVRELRQRQVQHVIFSGDATTMGFETEFHEAATRLGVGLPESLPGIAVPGNHDYYTRAAARGGLFEKYFSHWQQGLRLEDEHIYPFAQQVGNVWLIGVNSSTQNRWFWDSSGEVGAAQRDRLRRLLDHLPAGPRILVTHYPVCVASGHPEPRWRRLRDWQHMLEVAVAGGVNLWVHGHRHAGYTASPLGNSRLRVVCSGSATQNERWSYCEYTVHEGRIDVQRRVYSLESAGYVDAEHFVIDLPQPRPALATTPAQPGQADVDFPRTNRNIPIID